MKFSVVVKKIVVLSVEAESSEALAEALEDETASEYIQDYVDTIEDDVGTDDESPWETTLEMRKGVKDVPVELRLAKGKFSEVIDVSDDDDKDD